MTFRPARPEDRPGLTKLWQQAFGDPVSFIDLFFESGFAPERSRVCILEDRIAAMLYWFDCTLEKDRYAYIYAVATDGAFQGRGIATALMEDVHSLLAGSGYRGAILSPGSESLFRFYRRMGYETVGFVTEQTFSAGTPMALRETDAQAFAVLRRALLPGNGIRQEGANLAYLSRFARFYAGADWIAAVSGSTAAEYLGPPERIPGLLGALGLDQARVRLPGNDRPLVMGLSLNGQPLQEVYFGFPFD